MPMSAPRRLARALACAALSTFVALGGHVLAGGAMPTAAGVAVPLAVSVAVCGWLAGRELSLWRLSVAVLSSQWLFHTLFVVGAADVSVAASDPTAHHSALLVDAGNHAGHGAHAMSIAHIAAAILTIAAIYRAEAAWVALRDGVASLIARWRAPLCHAPLTIAPPRVFAAAGPARSRRLSPARSGATRRGPPVLAR